MRKLLVASIMSVGVIMQAQATSTDLYTPKMNAYLNYSFGAPKAQSLGLHYGFRMDYSADFQSAIGHVMPSLMQMDFSADHGFTSAQLNGLTFLTRSYRLNQTGEEGAPAESTSTGEGSAFTTLDWGLLAAGVVGVGFGIAQVAKNDESPDPKTSIAASGSPSGGGTCAPGTVPVVGGQCAPTTPPLAGGACAPGTVPVVGGQCAPNPTSGTTAPGANGLCAPGTVPVIGGQCAPTTPQGAGGLCAPGTVPIIGGQCAPTGLSSYGRSFIIETRDLKHDAWLDSEYGHMGDLYQQ